MSRHRPKGRSRVVYSTGPDGVIERGREGKPEAAAPSEPRPVEVRRERSGRKGKTVTVAAPVDLDREEARLLVRDLKKRCGAGGTLQQSDEGMSIEIQGDVVELVRRLLRERGLKLAALACLMLTLLACSTGHWRRSVIAPAIDPAEPLTAGFLIVEGVYNSELTAPYDIFHHTPFHTKPHPGIEVFTVGRDRSPIRTFEGLLLTPHYGLDDHPPIDILVVPSAEGSMDKDLLDRRMIDWVRRTGERARFIVSLCDGAFVLAEAGLLDGHACTTFPSDQDRFAEMYPELDLRRGVSFVHDGKALTSEGGAKSFDVAMHLVDHIYGEKVTRGVGRGLIIDWPPRGMRALVLP